MNKYCLEQDIITRDDIKFEMIFSLTIPHNYCYEFIDNFYKNIDFYDAICGKLNIRVDNMKNYK